MLQRIFCPKRSLCVPFDGSFMVTEDMGNVVSRRGRISVEFNYRLSLSVFVHWHSMFIFWSQEFFSNFQKWFVGQNFRIIPLFCTLSSRILLWLIDLNNTHLGSIFIYLFLNGVEGRGVHKSWCWIFKIHNRQIKRSIEMKFIRNMWKKFNKCTRCIPKESSSRPESIENMNTY